jgi:chemotaxis protein MotB
MSADEHDCKCPPVGVPAYMATFADLMALLMCFFVLLLSFAEMDVLKFKRLAGSMRTAFGVQRVVEANEIPMGTSIIAQEFSPGRPEPTPINDVKQRTSEQDQRNLQVQCTPDQLTEEVTLTQNQSTAQDKALVDQLAEMIEETRRDAVDLANALSTQIKKGEVEIETRGRDITVRIKEQGSFASGSAQLRAGFKGVLHDVRDVLSGKTGDILVQGHTDNIAISTSRFRSNWELSTARAVSVAHELLTERVLNPQRLTVSGYSDTRPLVENDSKENRALNRRVEIVVSQGLDTDLRTELNNLKEGNPLLYQDLDVKLTPRFDIRPDEIF